MIAQQIKTFRQLAGLSQWELAARVGSSQSTISQIERSQILLSPAMARKIARALDIDADLLAEPGGGK